MTLFLFLGDKTCNIFVIQILQYSYIIVVIIKTLITHKKTDKCTKKTFEKYTKINEMRSKILNSAQRFFLNKGFL